MDKLISAEALKEYARVMITHCVCDGETEAANYWRDFIDAIDDAPTVPAVVLPCAVGDTVYRVYTKSFVQEDIVMCFTILRNVIMYEDNYGRATPITQFGKTVFLTREAAEAALKGAEG